MKRRIIIISIVAILLVCFIGVSFCRQSTSKRQPTSTTQQVNTQDMAMPNQEQSVSQPNSNIPKRIELPEVRNDRWFIQHQHYALEYDTAQRHSIWVAYVLHADYLQRNVSRTNAWALDPIIPRKYQSVTNPSQTFPGYDRGHLLSSGDRLFSMEANRETFYFSNMTPQVASFNRHKWATLESQVRKWAERADTLYVVTGGAINPGVEIIGKLEERNHKTIPKYYFKALVKRTGDEFDGIAFWLENKRYESNRITHAYSITIRELEQLTGINFFPNLKYTLPGNPNLEEQVETVRDTTKWVVR